MKILGIWEYYQEYKKRLSQIKEDVEEVEEVVLDLPSDKPNWNVRLDRGGGKTQLNAISLFLNSDKYKNASKPSKLHCETKKLEPVVGPLDEQTVSLFNEWQSQVLKMTTTPDAGL
jgi:hypothetical protein